MTTVHPYRSSNDIDNCNSMDDVIAQEVNEKGLQEKESVNVSNILCDDNAGSDFSPILFVIGLVSESVFLQDPHIQ